MDQDLLDYSLECKGHAIDFINRNDRTTISFPSEDQTSRFRDWVDEWFNANDSTLTSIDSYGEDEECLLEMFETFFRSEIKDPEFGLFIFRSAYGYLCDQQKVIRSILEDPSSTRYNGLLDKLDGFYFFQTEKTRAEAKAFFEKTLIPYAKDDTEIDRFWKHFAEEMIFGDDESSEPLKKRNKI